MVEIYNHQYLWDNRQEQRLYDAFVDIWDREDLWVGIDRANLNPPKKVPGNPNGFIHWDVDTTLDPPPVSVQGVLSLVKQDDAIGGFQCVPELFYNFKEWVKTQPADRNPMMPDIDRGEDRQRRDGPRRPPDLQQPPRARRPAEPLRQPRAHGAVHRHVSGRRGPTRKSGRSASGCGASATTRGAAGRAIRAIGRRRTPRWRKLTPLGEKLLGLRRWSES